MSGEFLPAVAFLGHRNQAYLETEKRPGAPDQEGVPAFEPGHLTHRTVWFTTRWPASLSGTQ
jgi:hypothetical protein